MKTLCLNVTDSCCISCRYCFCHHAPNFMPFQVADDAAKWLLSQCENPNICFFGGEPTMCWDDIIVPLVEKYPQINYSITTNGVLLDEERIKFTSEHKMPFLLSMDGAEETQSYNRDKASFGKLDSLVIPTLLEYFPNTTFRGTIIPATCAHTLENIFYAQNKGFKKCFFTINIFEDWDNEARAAVEQAIDSYAYYYSQSYVEDKSIIELTPFTAMIKNIIRHELDIGERDASENKCGLGKNYAAVDYKGDIYTCQEVVTIEDYRDRFKIGDIYNGIDEKALKRVASYMVNDIEIKSTEEDKCYDCPLKSTCKRDTCQINNMICSGNCLVQSENQCWWNQLLYKEAYKVISLLQNIPNFQDYMKRIISGKEEI